MKFYNKLPLLLLFAVLSLFINTLCVMAQNMSAGDKPTVAVITDVNHRAGTIYLVTGASSDIIASELITKLNQTNLVYAPVLGDSMQRINKNFNLYTNTFFNEYKYNYNVDFVNMRRVVKDLDADYLLMVTSGLDVQSNFLKDTIWNKLAIAGMDPVRPTYRLTTLLTLIDIGNEAVLWQSLYKKDITANNYDIGVVQFAPSYAQLSKIKKYSQRVAEHVTPIVNVKINPALLPKKETSAVEFRKKDINEDARIYYPAIRAEKFKKKQSPQIEQPYFTPQTQRDPNIEDINNFTPKNPAFDPNDAIQNYSSSPSKPELKPAVNVKKKESVPNYEWNLKNIYDKGQNQNKGFGSHKKLKNIETVTL